MLWMLTDVLVDLDRAIQNTAQLGPRLSETLNFGQPIPETVVMQISPLCRNNTCSTAQHNSVVHSPFSFTGGKQRLHVLWATASQVTSRLVE